MDFEYFFWNEFRDPFSLVAAVRKGEISPEAKDEFGETPLMAVCGLGHIEMVRELLTLGVDASVHDGTCSVLWHAIESGNLEIVKLIFEAGGNLEFVSSGFFTPLAQACWQHSVEIAEYLLNQGANIEARGEMGETPLIESARWGDGNLKIIELLLKNNADRSSFGHFGTAIEVALRNGQAETVKLLEST
jgi:ankyrin repeat protein